MKKILVKIAQYLKRSRWTILIFLIFVLAIGISTIPYYQMVVAANINYNGVTIVIDAGHGGRDGGCVGVAGSIEKELNLNYALTLKDILVNNGYRVELTRKKDEGLYNNLAVNKKTSDMKERLRIIQNTNPNLVISIHMNSFPSTNVAGASTFFRKGDRAGETISNIIQSSLSKNCRVRSSTGKVGDYYMLNSSYYTAVLIECGFLSNPEEEKLLQQEDYRQKFCLAIKDALLLYFGVR